MKKRSTKIYKHQVKSVNGKERLADYAAKAFPKLGSRTAAKKAIAQGRLLVNGKRANPLEFVQLNDRLQLSQATKTERHFETDLPVIFEDDHLIVVNKPAGIATNGNRIKTVENAVLPIVKKSREADALDKPTAVHRIDVPTRGLVILAKTKSALIKMSKAFEQNQVQKTYVAVVHGKTKPDGQVDEKIQGKDARTLFQTQETAPSRIYKYLSLLELKPVTGRTHQLRIHLNNQGHLIVGDKQYAQGQKTILGKGMMLCACRLEFTHPLNHEELDLSIPVPKKFIKLIQREKERF